jgi:hypothetical protein
LLHSVSPCRSRIRSPMGTSSPTVLDESSLPHVSFLLQVKESFASGESS